MCRLCGPSKQAARERRAAGSFGQCEYVGIETKSATGASVYSGKSSESLGRTASTLSASSEFDGRWMFCVSECWVTQPIECFDELDGRGTGCRPKCIVR